MVIDGKSSTFVFDGQTVGGVIQARFSNGDSREVAHRPLASDTTKWLPGQVSYGIVDLQVYRNDADPGQAAILASRDNRQTRQMTITLADGTVKTFPAYARNVPSVTGKTTVNIGNIVMRIADKIV